MPIVVLAVSLLAVALVQWTSVRVFLKLTNEVAPQQAAQLRQDMRKPAFGRSFGQPQLRRSIGHVRVWMLVLAPMLPQLFDGMLDGNQAGSAGHRITPAEHAQLINQYKHIHFFGPILVSFGWTV